MPLTNAQKVAAYRKRKAARISALEANVSRYEAVLRRIADPDAWHDGAAYRQFASDVLNGDTND